MPRVAESPVSLECVLHGPLPRRQHGRVRPGRARSPWESAVRDGRPRIEHLRPLARLGGNEWSTIGEVKEIRRIPYPSGPRTRTIGERLRGELTYAGRCGATSSAASAPKASANRPRKGSRGSVYSWVPTTSTAAVATAEPSWVARSRPSPHSGRR